MKNHLKRIAAPKTWLINRKQNVFITRPSPGAHSLARGLPLGNIIRDHLKLAKTMSEVKRLINNHEILVDGRRRKDHRLNVGLFDVLAIPPLKKYYQIGLDALGRLALKELSEGQSSVKTCKVVGKTMLKKGVIQLCLHDGKTLRSDNHVAVGDSIEIELPSLKIKKTLPLKSGAKVLLVAGKHSGANAIIEEITATKAICRRDQKQLEAAKSHLFVIG